MLRLTLGALVAEASRSVPREDGVAQELDGLGSTPGTSPYQLKSWRSCLISSPFNLLICKIINHPVVTGEPWPQPQGAASCHLEEEARLSDHTNIARTKPTLPSVLRCVCVCSKMILVTQGLSQWLSTLSFPHLWITVACL